MTPCCADVDFNHGAGEKPMASSVSVLYVQCDHNEPAKNGVLCKGLCRGVSNVLSSHAVVSSSTMRGVEILGAQWLGRKAAHPATPQIKECASERGRTHAK